MMMDEMRRVLVLVTPTTDCIDVVGEAFAIAGRFQSTLYVLDVVHNPFAYTGWNLPMPSFENEYQRNLTQVRDRLQSMVVEGKGKGFAIETLVREGEPSEQIIKVIEEQKIGLLMLPQHAEGRMEHYFSSRIAERVIRRMPCSVLLVRVDDTNLCAT